MGSTLWEPESSSVAPPAAILPSLASLWWNTRSRKGRRYYIPASPVIWCWQNETPESTAAPQEMCEWKWERINMNVTRSLSIGIFSTEVSPHAFGILRIHLSSRPLSPKYQYFSFSPVVQHLFTQQIVIEFVHCVKPCAGGSGGWKIKCCLSLQELIR